MNRKVTLLLSDEIYTEIITALKARQRAMGSGSDGFRLCSAAISQLEDAFNLQEPSKNGTNKSEGKVAGRINPSPQL